MESNGNVNSYDDEIDLKELLLILWSGKISIVAITAVFAVASVLYALSIPNQYKATALLAPAQSESGGLSSALGQLGGLASLAGVSIGASQTTESQVAQEVMKSWNFVDSFIAYNNLEFETYAVNGWDATSGEFTVDPEIFDITEGDWVIASKHSRQTRPPTSWELFQRFSEILSVSEDKKTGLVYVSMEHYSPKIAKDLVDSYVTAINKYMQARQISKVENNIAYLEHQIEQTSIAEMREVFYTIIEEQTKNKMVAEASPEYAFVAVSQSMLPEEKSKPSRAIISVAGTLLGGLLGVVFVFSRHFLR